MLADVLVLPAPLEVADVLVFAVLLALVDVLAFAAVLGLAAGLPDLGCDVPRTLRVRPASIWRNNIGAGVATSERAPTIDGIFFGGVADGSRPIVKRWAECAISGTNVSCHALTVSAREVPASARSWRANRSPRRRRHCGLIVRIATRDWTIDEPRSVAVCLSAARCRAGCQTA